MDGDYMHEVFSICKKLQNNDIANRIKLLIYNMSISEELKDNEKVNNKGYGDFAYLAKHCNNEFHGFLFVDDTVETLDIPHPLRARHLVPEDRHLIEQGHKTLIRFTELCLNDIADKEKIVAESMNPYFQFKEVHVSEDVKPILSDEELQPAVAAFKKGIVYNALIKTNFTAVFKGMDLKTMHVLTEVTEREIGKSLIDKVEKDIIDFLHRIDPKMKNASDAIFAYSILMYALKESLRIACRMFYRAICGDNLFVLDNDNIINIETESSNSICRFYKVLTQGAYISLTQSDMGSILLMDCDTLHNTKIHVFGMLIAETINFDCEFGETAKYSIVTVNEELIYIQGLIDHILNVGLPIVVS